MVNLFGKFNAIDPHFNFAAHTSRRVLITLKLVRLTFPVYTVSDRYTSQLSEQNDHRITQRGRGFKRSRPQIDYLNSTVMF